jgi:diketogulonate reductase-like aldo/keto reductase
MIQKPHLNGMEFGQEGTRIAFGTGTAWWQGPKGNNDGTVNSSLVSLVKTALKLGYRHLDCAEIYGTEPEVGIALKEFLSENPSITRNDIYITSKVFPGLNDIRGTLKEILSRLQISSLDLYLIHAPFFSKANYSGSLKDAWTQMESVVNEGLTRHIGVSNYRIEDFEEFLPSAKIKPVCNQIEFNPYLQQPELQEYCKKHGIKITCYSPLAPLHLKTDGPVNPVIEKIASKYGKTNARILLKWVLQKGHLAITTSRQEDRLKEFLSVETTDKDLVLTEEEMKEIDEVGSKIKFRKYWQEEFGDK